MDKTNKFEIKKAWIYNRNNDIITLFPSKLCTLKPKNKYIYKYEHELKVPCDFRNQLNCIEKYGIGYDNQEKIKYCNTFEPVLFNKNNKKF